MLNPVYLNEASRWLPLIFRAQWNRYDGWHMGPGMMGGWGGGWLGMIFWAAFWILILIVIVLAIKRLLQNNGGGGRRAAGDSRAMDILKERFARGEIDRDQFESMKRDLLK